MDCKGFPSEEELKEILSKKWIPYMDSRDMWKNCGLHEIEVKDERNFKNDTNMF